MTNTAPKSIAAGPLILAALAAVLAATPGTCGETYNGFYVGGDFGYESSGRTSKDGWTWGGLAGFNVRLLDRIVVGGEVRVADSTIKERLRSETSTNVTLLDSKVDRSIGLAARIGYLATDDTLLFVRAGWDNTRFSAVQTVTPKPPAAQTPVVTRIADNDDTLTLGAGVEQFVTDTVSLRLTYDWAENFDRHQVRAGIAFNF
jgi:opacity protein-like surface antigen